MNILKFLDEHPNEKYYDYNDITLNLSLEYRHGLAIWTPQFMDMDADEQIKLFASYGCYRNYVEYYPISEKKLQNLISKVHGLVFMLSDKIFVDKEISMLLYYMTQDPGAYHIVFCGDGDFTKAGELLDHNKIEQLYVQILDKITINSPITRIGYYQLNMRNNTAEKQMTYLKESQKITEDMIYHNQNYSELLKLLDEKNNVHLYVYSLSNLENNISEILSMLIKHNHTLYILKHDDYLNPHTYSGLHGKDLVNFYEDYCRYGHWKHILSCYQDEYLDNTVTNYKTKSNLEKVIELRNAGKTQKEIAAETGLSVPTISRLYRKINKLQKM